MNPVLAFVFIALTIASLTRGQDDVCSCGDVLSTVQRIESSVNILTRQELENKVSARFAASFSEVEGKCASDGPASSLPLGSVPGLPSDVSGEAICSLYCRAMDGCIAFNFLSTPAADGTQCQFFKQASSACAASGTCRYFVMNGEDGGCGSVRHTEGREITLEPEADPQHHHVYHYFADADKESKSVVIQVKMSEDVHIGLFTGVDLSTIVYEIPIGGWSNAKSAIRGEIGQYPALVTVATNGFCSDTEYRTFWVSWSDHVIRVGRGSCVGQSEFMKYVEPPNTNHDINVIQVSQWLVGGTYRPARAVCAI